jgi:uncharacterized protein (DUF885 family)
MPASDTTPDVSAALASLADQYWQRRLAADPIEATLLGDRRFDDRLPDPSPEANQVEIDRLTDLTARVGALDASGLSGADRITHGALLSEIGNELAVRRCAIAEWAVDPLEGPQVLFLNLAHLQSVGSPEDGRALTARWHKVGDYLDARTANLRRAAGQGRVATAEAVTRVLRQLDELLSVPSASWVMMEPGRTPHPGWNEGDRRALEEGVRGAVEQKIRPAFERYRQVLRSEIAPRARDDRAVGLLHVPGGEESYRRLIGVHTSLSLSAEQIHRIGLEENARIRAEMTDLGERLFQTADLAQTQKRLREDPALYFSTRQEVEDKAREALARAEAAMPRWFGRLARTRCVVKRVEPYEERDTTIAYYRQPAIDGSRPGTYHVNTYAPETRPRYEAEVLAFHESVPGHHTQIALAQEQTGLPEFRKHLGVTAYVEGWALYTERLAAEMGLYTDDLDRMGMLSFDAWRASRLVVDTGLHVKGWNRQQALTYLMENTALAANNIENEVNRYVAWPGQALAYKLGQREIFALRREAEKRLGARFNVRTFHDAVLAHGAISLPLLRAEVERWSTR